MSNNDEQNQEGDWIWEPLPEDDETQANNMIGIDGSESKLNIRKTNSEKSLGSTKSSFNTTKITSSPSFQELEKAIGATLNMSSADSGELSERNQSPKTLSKSKSSSTDLTQQKLNQQRLRQQQHTQRYTNYNTQYRQGNSVFSHPTTTNLSAREELAPFIHESESRAIILFHSALLPPIFIRNACSKSGVLYYIRPEFHAKGVTLISYFDLRAAISAISTIIDELGPDAEVSAHYSVMLHAANSNTEEFRLVVRNLPDICAESDVQAIFSRYGPLRSIQKTFIENVNSTESLDQSVSSNDLTNSKVAYSIEYYNIQDARLAASELSATSSTLWGSDATVIFAPLENRKQQLCRQLLSILSRWRNEMSVNSSMMNINMLQSQQTMNLNGIPMHLGMSHHSMEHLNHPNASHMNMGIATNGYPQMSIPMISSNLNDTMQYYDPASQQIHHMQNYPLSPLLSSSTSSSVVPVQQMFSRFNLNPSLEHHQHPSSHVVNGMGNSNATAAQSNAGTFEQQNNFYFSQQNNLNLPYKNNYKHVDTGVFNNFDSEKEVYSSNNIRSFQKYPRGNVDHRSNQFPDNASSTQQQQQYHPHHVVPPPHHNGAYAQNHFIQQQQYTTTTTHNNNNHHHQQQQRSKQAYVNNIENNNVAHKDNQVDINFLLDPSKIGQDDRTTIMVRNIPNKYNQQMILEEVNMNHEGTYDFFYLPIDFKNRCNVGYCFINFIDPKYISPFIDEFNGKRWKSFNSEKVCAVSFARIQGKQAMIARFQNSSLLDKDDEYQPLLFYSSGPDVGKPEPFHVHKATTTTRQFYPQVNKNIPSSDSVIGSSDIRNSCSPDIIGHSDPISPTDNEFNDN